MSGSQADRLRAMLDRALLATDAAFTITDPLAEDNPLVWCNPAFCKLTGYSVDEIVGRNCRMLQGPNTDPVVVSRIGAALRERRPVTEVLLNYRKNGHAFWNEVRISPVFDEHANLVNFVGVQTDVTERVMVQHERQAALAEAEETRQGLSLLTQASSAMTESLDVGSAVNRLVDLAVPALSDYCCVDILDEPGVGVARRVAVKHRGPEETEALYRLGKILTPHVGGTDPVSRVLSGEPPLLIPDMPLVPETVPEDDEVVLLYRKLRPRSTMVVPLRARGRVLGALTLVTEQPYGRRYDDHDLHLAADLAARAGLAVDNARLYAVEHAAAETLQRSLLPAAPVVPGLSVAARYRVGGDAATVGGDWYDLLPLPDGAVGLAVGDVVGHDLRAAAAMGELRGVLRSYAWEGLAPGQVLDRCDRLVQGMDMAAMATVFYARLERPDGEGIRLLRYASAGHPPPLLRLPDGATRVLDEHHSPLIGAVPTDVREGASQPCPPGSLLLLYTDGLTEVPGHDPVERFDMLRRVVAGAAPDIDVERLCDRVLDVMASPNTRDDVALLAVRINVAA
jgi:PAS domain S-box-containing protein